MKMHKANVKPVRRRNEPKFRVYHCILLLLTVFDTIGAQYLKSPCPDIFTYQLDPETNNIFGYIELSLQVGQVAKLNVDLSIGTNLKSNYVGEITLLKSRNATFNDILRGLPAQYRVNFPLRNILPSVLSIVLNDRTICAGYPADGSVVTTINLKHTLFSQVKNKPPKQTSPKPRPPSQPVVQRTKPTQRRPTTQQTRKPQVTQRWPTEYDTRPQTTIATRPVPVRTTVAPPKTNYKCGRPSAAFLNRLTINGELVDKGQFPWIVPLFDRSYPRNPHYVCGSTIITRNHLVTAAHCVYENDEIMEATRILAVPGMYNIDNFLDENAKFALISAVIANDEYNHDDELNDADLAVLKLKTSLVYTDYIIPICPWQGENNLGKIVGREGFVAGWGITEKGSTPTPTYIRAFIVDSRSCRENLARQFPSNSRIFCADGQGSAPCNGDSGSGLVIKSGNQYYLRGIVSKGRVDPDTLKCDTKKYAIYTDIALYRFWLKSATSQ